MKVFLWEEKQFFSVNRKEELDNNTYIISDEEEHHIRTTMDNGGVLWLDNDEIKWSGSRPDELHVWNNITKVWDMDPELRDAKRETIQEKVWTAIKKKRDSQVMGGVFIPSVAKVFQTDPTSAIIYAQIGNMISLNIYEIINWKVLDNTFVPITEELFREIQTTIARSTQLTYDIAEQHKAAMLISDNPEDYDYTTGWMDGVLPIDTLEDSI